MSAGSELRRTAKAVREVPRTIVQDVSDATIAEGARTLGTFTWPGDRRRKLAVRRKPIRGVSSSAGVLLVGSDRGAISIKSYGRRGGYAIRPRRSDVLNLRGAGTFRSASASAVGVATQGDARWDRLYTFAATRSQRVATEATRKATR